MNLESSLSDDDYFEYHLLTDFAYFVRYFFRSQYNKPFILAPYHQEVVDALVRVVNGETTRLIINIPPRYAKTEIVIKMFVAWCLANNPSAKFIHLSYSDDLALDNSSAIRDLVKSAEFQKFFPMALRSDSDSKKKWLTEARGGLYATAAGGAITGFGAGAMGRVYEGTGSPADGFAGCFPYDELVNTESGLMKIGDVVTKRINVRVWSRNFLTGADELKPIKTFWTNPPNRIVEVGLSDGATFQCTPNHEIMTSAGWVEAKDLCSDPALCVPFPDVFELVNCDSKTSAKRISADAGVHATVYQILGDSWFEVPLWVREVFGNRCPSLSHLDLPDDPVAQAISLLKISDRFVAGENLNDLLSGEFCSGSSLKHWKCSVPDGVLHVVGLRSVGEVSEPVVDAVSVKVPNFFAFDLRPIERANDKLVDKSVVDDSVLGKPDAKPPVCALLWLENCSGERVWSSLAWRNNPVVAHNPPLVANRVEPFIPGDRKPLFIRDIGHADVTFCLEVWGNNNFYVSSRQVLVSNCILIDDPIKPDDAFSDTMRDRVNRRFNNTIASRTNSPETPIVVIMQRLHENDLTGYLLNGGSGESWEHVCLPAIQEDGTALWPVKHTIEMLRVMEEADPYTFAGQYMQTPSPLTGGIIKPDNIQIIDAVPAGKIEWVRGWDFASTTNGDFTAGLKLGLMEDGRLVIADIVHIRVGPDERDAALVNAAARDGYGCKISIPQDPGQAGVTQIKYLTRKLAGYTVKSSPESGSKVVRAEPIASQINVGNVLMVKSAITDKFINECRMFPNGSFDDMVDALSRAYMPLIGRNPAEIFIPDLTVKDLIAAAGTCGRCSAYDKPSGLCKENFGLSVGEMDVGCGMFLPG